MTPVTCGTWRASWRRSLWLSLVFSAGRLVAGATEVHVRLVDAAGGTPLEYWDKTVEQAELASTLCWRMPTRVVVDGRPWSYARSGAGEADLKREKPTGADKALDALQEELGTAAPKDADVLSDRATEVRTGSGPRALVAGALDDGDHVLEPGGVRFRVLKGEIGEVAAPLVKTGASSLRLLCRPVDISFPPVSRGALSVEVVCLSGGAEVFRETVHAARSLGLRLYLPDSTAGYTLKAAGVGELSFSLDQAGAHVRGSPTLAEGVLLAANGPAITFFSKVAPTSAVAAPTAPAAGEREIHVFVDRNRSVFVEGETVQISVRAWGAAPADDRVSMRLEGDGGALELGAVSPARAGNQAAAEVEVGTLALRPGAYRLRATWGGVEANPLALRVTPLMPETNMKLFGYSKWNKASFDPKDLASVPRAGFNLVVAEAGGWANRSPFSDWGAGDSPAGVATTGKRSSAHAPPELAETPLEHDAGAEFLLAHGIENVPIACGLILYFNVGDYWKSHADDRNQGIQHHAQEWRRFPNFRGIVHCSGDGPTPATMGTVFAAGAGSFDIIHGQRLAKLREAFDAKVGKLKIDDAAARAEFEKINSRMQGAIGFGLGMDAGLKLEGDDAAKLEWTRWINDLYPDCFRGERAALSAMMGAPVVNCSHTWGPGAGSGMWEETFFRDLDNPVVDIHGDYGIMPLSYSCGSDVVSMGQRRRPWIALDLLPERSLANGMKLFLEGLSRNPAGIGGVNALASRWSDRKDPSERLTVVVDLARRFGDLFSTLDRRDEIAVLASMRQDALAGQPQAAVWGAHFLATKAGYQPNVITEEECLREPGTLGRFKAVFLVHMTVPLPPALTEKLAAFQSAGGIVLADAETKTDLPGVVRVPRADMLFANQVDFREAYGRFEPLVVPFREAVTLKLPPFFGSSEPDVHLVRSVDQDLEYWTLFNDTLQSREECPGGHWAQFQYKGVESDLTAARQGVVYDAFRRRPVDVHAAAGKLAWHADMRYLPGTVYLCADRPIAALSVSAVRRVAAGSALRIRAAALDAGGKAFAGRLPVEIVVRDPSDAVRYRLYRTTNRDVDLKIAGNDPAGRWTWTVTDQATGLAASGGFDVAGQAVAPAARAVQDMVYDGWAIGAALRGREFDIILYADQGALRDMADRLAGDLQKAGAKVSVRVIGPAVQRLYPMNWSATTVEDREVEQAVLAGEAVGLRSQGKNQFGSYKRDPMKDAFYGQFAASAALVYCRDVILLGRGDVPDNPMLDLIVRRTRMLPRNPSPSFPAAGFGFAAYAWGPFHYGQDAIVLYGRDEAGLSRAAARVVELARAPASERPTPAWRQPDECGQSYARLGLAAAGAADVVVTGTVRTAESLLPEGYARRLVAARTDGGDRLVIRQEPTADAKGPVFAEVNLKTGAARVLNLELPAFRKATLDVLARSDAARLASPLILRTPRGRLVPLGRGLALLDDRDAVLWFYDPFPRSQSLDEAQYPRLCHRLALSADGRTAAAAFYDLGAGGSYGPKYRQFNEAAVALLDVDTGREVGRCRGYLADRLALSADGSRCFVVDVQGFEQGRGRWNPHGGPTFAAFDRKGEELFALPADAASDLAVSGNGALAVVSYDDTRRYVSVIDIAAKREHRVEYARIDRGTAAAADGSFAVIAYADGLVREVTADGRIAWEERAAAPGVPAVAPDGTVILCADDGRVYFPKAARQPVDFGSAAAETVSPGLDAPPAGLLPPARPFWADLAGEWKPESLPLPSGMDLTEVKGERTVTFDVPRREPLDAVLFAFRYRLATTSDTLRVVMTSAEGKPSFLFPFAAQPRTVSVPMRPKQAGPVTLAFSSASGAAVDQTALLRLKTGDFDNAALAGVGRGGANPNTPRVLVPNIHGCLGDPRVEQVGFGFPEGKFSLPDDVTPPVKTDVFSLFNGNLGDGTPLYPTVWPGHAPWDPPEARPTLRSAQVVMEFAKPRTVAGVGVWEHPNGPPVAAFALECSSLADARAREAAGGWKLVLEVRDNADYYHLHVLPKPVPARFWRYTVLETPCLVQRVSEIELYESAVDSLEQSLDEAPKPEALPSL